MLTAIQQFYKSPIYTKAFHWLKLIALTGGAQAMVQGIGLISGILVIRLLPTQEYAFYTLANTMLGTMTILADSGISTGVMAQGGKVWQDKEKLGAVLATGLDLRRKFSISSLIISLPILIYLLLHQGANWITSIFIALSIIPAFYATLSDSLLGIIPRLHQDIKSLQSNQVLVAIGRFLLISLGLFAFPWTFIALLANGFPRIYGNIKLKIVAYKFVDQHQKSDTEIRNKILKTVKRMLPEIIYYCLSGQINIWLIALFGSTTALASLGALGRLSMVLNLFSILFGTLIVPRFSRLSENKKLLFNYAIGVLIGAVSIGGIFLGITFLFSSQLLFIIGDTYNGMQAELLLSILGASITFLHGCFFSLLVNRGWIINPIFYILLSFSTTVLAATFFNVSTLQGVLMFNVLISIVQALTLITYCFIKISFITSSMK